MEKVRIGIIGSGSICEIAHFPAIRDIAEAELVAICDIKEEVVTSAATRWGIRAWYTDYRDMLEKEELDAVIVASPNHLHHEHALAAIEAGIATIVEKPLACTNKEAWDIVEASKKAKVKLMVGCNYRFWHQHEIAKDLLEKGVIGEVKLGRACLHEAWNLYHERISVTNFRQVPNEAGAGALFDLGAHMVDLLRWFMGSEVKKVMGIVDRTVTPKEYTILDDTVLIQMQFANGSYGFVSLNRFSPAVSQATELWGSEGTICLSSEAQHPYQSAPLAIFTNKDYNWEDLPQVIRDYRYPQLFWADDNIAKPLPKRWISIYPPREWSYLRMIKHFIECLVEDKEPRIKGEDGAKVMEVLCAVIKSSETGTWVELPLKEEIVPPHYRTSRGKSQYTHLYGV